MKLKLKNFSLFKEETSFDIAPLTLLIGANSSGKSTFLQSLDTLHQLIVNTHGSFKKTTDEGFILKDNYCDFNVSKYLFARIKFESKTINKEIDYVTDNGLSILNVKQLKREDDIICRLDIKLLNDIITKIIVDLEKDDVKPFIKKSFKSFKELIAKKDNELIKKFSSKILSPHDFFKITFKKIDNYIIQILDVDTRNKNLTDFVDTTKNRFFGFSYFADDPNWFDYKKDDDQLNRTTLVKKNIGDSKKIYDRNNPLFKYFLDLDIPNNAEEKLIIEHFFCKWIDKFFGANTSYELIPIHNSDMYIIAYEFKLNNVHLFEWGSGAYRCIYYILKFSFAILSKCVTEPWLLKMDIEDNVIDGQVLSLKEVIENHIEDMRYETNDPNYEHEREKDDPEYRLRVLGNSIFNSQLMIIEEPEINLHPDHQCVMAELIYDFSTLFNGHIIIETHSEYMIRTFQNLRATEKWFTNNHLNIINFGYGKNLGKVNNIKIEEDGSLSDSFYSGFMNHAQELQLKLLSRNRKIKSN